MCTSKVEIMRIHNSEAEASLDDAKRFLALHYRYFWEKCYQIIKIWKYYLGIYLVDFGLMLDLLSN